MIKKQFKMVLTTLSIEEFKKSISEIVKQELKNIDLNEKEKANDEFLTRKETAMILGVSLVSLHEWTMQGFIKGYRIGSRVRYKRSDIESSLKQIKSVKK